MDKEVKELFNQINSQLQDINSKLNRIELQSSNGNYTYTDTDINSDKKKVE